MDKMGRPRKQVEVIETTAEQQVKTQSDTPDEEFFSGFESLQPDLNIMVSKLEPYDEQGYCGKLHITKDQQMELPQILLDRWGGPALYKLQLVGQQINGKKGFSESKKLRISGRARNTDRAYSSQAPEAVYPSQQPYPAQQPYPPQQYLGQPQQGYYMPQNPLGAEMLKAIPGVLGPVIEVLKSALQQGGIGQLDVAKVVDSISTSVKDAVKPTEPPDELSRIERTAKLLKELRGPEVSIEGGGDGSHWIAAFAPTINTLMERALSPREPQQPVRYRLPKPPPGYRLDPSTYAYVPVQHPMQGPAETAQTHHQDGPDDEEEREEEDDDEDEEEGEDEPMDAETALYEIGRMDPAERDRMVKMYLAKHPKADPAVQHS